MPTEQELHASLLDKLYRVVVGLDDINNVKPIGGSFVSFCCPGIPLAADDLDFSFVDLAKSDTAADFASLANTVPPGAGRWFPSDRKVKSYYSRVLNETIRPVTKLNDAEKKRLQAAYDVLTRWVDAIDLTNGATKKVPADTPLYEAYQERMSDYLAALSAYKSVQANYLARTADPQAQAEWFTKGPILKQTVTARYNRWLASGKETVDSALQTIDELGRGTGGRWKALKDQLKDSQQITSEGANYLFTKFFPAKFWDEAHKDSWTRFSMTHDEVHTVDTKSSTNWGGSGSASLGLWSVGASASYAEQKQSYKSDTNKFTLQVDLIRVPIRRSWWDATIFWDRGWKFDPATTNMILSDGQIPPSGEMTSYPSALICAKNLDLVIDLTTENNSHVATQFSASGSVGYGPFSLKGNYSRNTDRKTHDFVRNAAGLTCTGMQIIGFVCELLPKSPNPDSSLNWQA